MWKTEQQENKQKRQTKKRILKYTCRASIYLNADHWIWKFSFKLTDTLIQFGFFCINNMKLKVIFLLLNSS